MDRNSGKVLGLAIIWTFPQRPWGLTSEDIQYGQFSESTPAREREDTAHDGCADRGNGSPVGSPKDAKSCYKQKINNE